MKRCLVALGLLAVAVFATAPTAEAKITSGTFYVCYDNGTKERGTTRLHLHRHKPSRQHYRKHHCRKITLNLPAGPTKTITVPVPGPTQTIYVTVPCPCQQPPPPCDSCNEGDDNDHGDDHGHGHDKGDKGHKGGHDKGGCD